MSTTVPYQSEHSYRATKSKAAQDIYATIQRGEYCFMEGKKRGIELIVKNSMVTSEKTSYVKEGAAGNISPNAKKYTGTKILFTNYDMAKLLFTESDISGKKQISVIGLGSATSICGEFQIGKVGYEESIGNCSLAYYTCSIFNDSFYKLNSTEPENGLYKDRVLCAKNIAVVKGPENSWRRFPTEINYYVSPAVNRYVAVEAGITDNKINSVMEARLRNILIEIINDNTAPYNTQERVLVVPPYGVEQGNNIMQISRILVKLLKQEKMAQYFSKIIFTANYNETHILPSTFRAAISAQVDLLRRENAAG